MSFEKKMLELIKSIWNAFFPIFVHDLLLWVSHRRNRRFGFRPLVIPNLSWAISWFPPGFNFLLCYVTDDKRTPTFSCWSMDLLIRFPDLRFNLILIRFHSVSFKYPQFPGNVIQSVLWCGNIMVISNHWISCSFIIILIVQFIRSWKDWKWNQ